MNTAFHTYSSTGASQPAARPAALYPQHLDVLRRTPFRPDLARLEKLTEVAEAGPGAVEMAVSAARDAFEPSRIPRRPHALGVDVHTDVIGAA